MRPTEAQIMEQARQLDDAERRELALELLDSTVDPAVQTAWVREAQRRVAEVDGGAATLLSDEDADRLISSDD
jgi:hypothetical protein